MPTPLILPPSEGELLNVGGDSIRLLADGKTTGGQFTAFESSTPPGHGPPLHVHNRDDEFFHILEGTAKFSIAGKETIVSAGTTLFAPKGTPHTFITLGKTPCRMLVICTPAGIETPFRECHQLSLQNNNSPEPFIGAFKKFDLEVVGPPLKP